jgi:DNA polymerase-3 subunit alpha
LLKIATVDSRHFFRVWKPDQPAKAEPPPDMPDWPLVERLTAEKELLGFYVTGHPLDPYRSILETYSFTDTSRLAEVAGRTMTRLGGILSAVQQGFSKKSGKPYAILTLEDLHGSAQLLCMNEAYDKHRDLFVSGKPVFVVGEVGASEDRPKIFPLEIVPLEEVPARWTLQVHLRFRTAIHDVAKLAAAREIVSTHPGSCPLFLCFQRPDGRVAFMEANDRYRVRPSLNLHRDIEALLGQGAYYAKANAELPERPKRRWESADNGGN